MMLLSLYWVICVLFLKTLPTELLVDNTTNTNCFYLYVCRTGSFRTGELHCVIHFTCSVNSDKFL